MPGKRSIQQQQKQEFIRIFDTPVFPLFDWRPPWNIKSTHPEGEPRTNYRMATYFLINI